jgi:ribosomal protein S18 acetylase RimI-like enzyme
MEHDEVDLQDLVDFTMEAQKELDEQLRCGQTKQEVREFLRGTFETPYSYVIARENRRIVGWAGISPYTASLMYLDGWHPVVKLSSGLDDVFRSLVQECISHTRRSGCNRLEVFLMNITDDVRKTYERYRSLYESAGMKQGNEWSHMACDLTALNLKQPRVPKGFSIRPLVEVNNEEIWPCYNATFLSSGDRRYREQTETQRRENFEKFFDRLTPIEEDASLLLYAGDSIVGFIKINLIRAGGFVNGIGTHPEYRRRGLGRFLLTASLARAAENQMNNVILEVDITNHSAIALYEQLGFKKTRGSISHVWTAGDSLSDE